MTKINLYVASDHGGLDLKMAIIQRLPSDSIAVLDLGPNSSNSVDYPDYADILCQRLLNDGPPNLGVLICGTGIGISIRANRYPGIRAALVTSAFAAEMTKQHNNANVLCLGGRTTSVEDALEYIHIWMTSAFEGGRHQHRLDKLDRPLLR